MAKLRRSKKVRNDLRVKFGAEGKSGVGGAGIVGSGAGRGVWGPWKSM